MMVKLRPSLLLIVLSILYNSCEKEYSLEGNAAGIKAVFSFLGSPGSCTNAAVNGTYKAGAALGTLNVVTITVNVTTPGTFTVSTATINGISFTGSGTFASAGTQIVNLTGSGTPLAEGVFDFTPGNNGCIFSITVVKDVLKCSIDGVARTFNMDLLGEKISSDTFDIIGNETLAANSPLFAIRLTKSPAITPGTYDRYLLTNANTFCLVAYLDGATATPWATGLSAPSSPFSVIVTSYTANRIEGTFSGTIYSDPVAGTGAKVITAGQFSVPY